MAGKMQYDDTCQIGLSVRGSFMATRLLEVFEECCRSGEFRKRIDSLIEMCGIVHYLACIDEKLKNPSVMSAICELVSDRIGDRLGGVTKDEFELMYAAYAHGRAPTYYHVFIGDPDSTGSYPWRDQDDFEFYSIVEAIRDVLDGMEAVRTFGLSRQSRPDLAQDFSQITIGDNNGEAPSYGLTVTPKVLFGGLFFYDSKETSMMSLDYREFPYTALNMDFDWEQPDLADIVKRFKELLLNSDGLLDKLLSAINRLNRMLEHPNGWRWTFETVSDEHGNGSLVAKFLDNEINLNDEVIARPTEGLAPGV